MSDTAPIPLYEDLKIEQKPDSEIELTGSIPVSVVDRYRSKAIERIGRDVELPGFRKGHVPADVIVQRVGDMGVLEEVAEIVLARAYPDIVINNKLEVVGRPSITITKMAPKEPIGFRIVTAVMPDVKLPEYVAIAERIRKENAGDAPEVSDEELAAFIKTIQQSTLPEDKKDDVPELTDAFVATIGPFASVADFKKAMHDHLKREKESQLREKHRTKLVDALLEKTAAEVPHLFIESEIEAMSREFDATLERMGFAKDDYLKRNNTTEEKLREEWRPHARKRALLQLLLTAIATAEGITPPADKVEREVVHLLEHLPDANEDSARNYVETMLTNEEVFRWLETERTGTPEQLAEK